MTRGAWKPWLPKGRSFMPSDWIGDHDFAFYGAVRPDEQDDYWRVGKTINCAPDRCHKNLKKMIERNRQEMDRNNI